MILKKLLNMKEFDLSEGVKNMDGIAGKDVIKSPIPLLTMRIMPAIPAAPLYLPKFKNHMPKQGM